jgi:hypothetical protein
MARNQVSQRQRTVRDPLLLGAFSSTSIRYLQGTLGPTHQLVGRADTDLSSNGGFGGGTYNHWFKIRLLEPAWIIITKGPPRPKYIQVSTYDLNRNPIEGRSIFDLDSVSVNIDGTTVYPYFGHMMNAQSNTYNFFNPQRIDKGDDRYFPLEVGEYLICISSTRNERLDYTVAIVVEVADPTPQLLTEDYDLLLFEDTPGESDIIIDTTPNYTGDEEHEHSLREWKLAWRRERQDSIPFPEILIPLTNPNT